ncbi:MAG: SUF system NifU family Fe-S cluster assembly protein [bacterium]|nr:SUF system NifU family Fe-S cluster assembly protein [bacterium]
MDDELKRAIILENYQNPVNRGLVNDNTYCKINTNSKSCIDQIDLEIKLVNGKIEDIHFDGEACAICTSSTSIMIKKLIGTTLNDAIEIINNFNNMIDEKEYNKDLLGEAFVYNGISKQPNRKNCATLTWNGIKDFLEVSDINERK